MKKKVLFAFLFATVLSATFSFNVKCKESPQISTKHGERWFTFVDNSTGLAVAALRYAIDVTFYIYSERSKVQMNETYQFMCNDNLTHRVEVEEVYISLSTTFDMMPDWNDTRIDTPTFVPVPASAPIKIRLISHSYHSRSIPINQGYNYIFSNFTGTYNNNSFSYSGEHLPRNTCRYSVTRELDYPDPELYYENVATKFVFVLRQESVQIDESTWTTEVIRWVHNPPEGYAYGLVFFENLTALSPEAIPMRQNLVLVSNFSYVPNPILIGKEEEINQQQGWYQELQDQYHDALWQLNDLTREYDFLTQELEKHRTIYLPLMFLAPTITLSITIIIIYRKRHQK